MGAIENPAKYQCALLKSSRKHYINALENMDGGKMHGHLTAAMETAEAAEDAELHGWILDIREELAGGGAFNMQLAGYIAVRYNEYNTICSWGLGEFDPNDPTGIPGDSGGVIE